MMKEVFFRVLDMSLSATWLVLAVILLRFALKKAPKYLHCILWAMVALRLICPSLPKSQTSLIPDNKFIASAVLTEQGSSPMADADQLVQLPSNLSQSSDTPQTEQKLMDCGNILSAVWGLGVAAMAGYGVTSYLHLRRKVAPSIREDGVWLCDAVPSPFILGIIRPRIYLPSHLDLTYRDSVLAHEQAHLRRKDHLWKPLGFALLSIHWFNPVMWFAYFLLCRDIEMACDERVVKKMDEQARKRYSEALLSCAAFRRSIAACPLAFGEQGVRSRIKSVLHYKKPTVWIIIVTIVAMSAVAVCFLTNPNTGMDKSGTGLDEPETTLKISDYQPPKRPSKYNISRLNVLKVAVPQYFGVDASEGLEVYVWDDEGMLWCGMMRSDNCHKTQAQIDQMDAVPLSSMAIILDTYDDIKDVSLYVLGESDYWGPQSKRVFDCKLEMWLKDQLGVLDVSIRHNTSKGVNVLTIRVGARLYIYESTGIMASDDQLGGCLIKDATFDRGFEPSGLDRFGHVDIYSAKGEDETQLIVGNQFYQFKVMGIE